jgi:hypothetical protein
MGCRLAMRTAVAILLCAAPARADVVGGVAAGGGYEGRYTTARASVRGGVVGGKRAVLAMVLAL